MLYGQTVTGPLVRFHTSLGDIDVTLLPDSAPKTVANFLKYVNRGSYTNSIFHRSVASFVIQGGGFQLISGTPVAIPSDAPILNEYKLLNTRGTIAMAKTSDPNSATTQWFFNEVDNSSTLNGSNSGGFTVFGKIANQAGLNVMDAIGALPISNQGTPFDQLPVINYSSGALQDSNYVLVTSIDQVGTVTVNGAATASAFGASAEAAPGSYIEIAGSNLAGSTRTWGDSDFVGGAAPKTLDGVSVTVAGQAAYVFYVSPSQVNVQIPASVPTGIVPVIVTYSGQASARFNLSIEQLQPGILAPSSFRVGATQYVAAVHSASGAFVSNGSVPGIAAAPAVAGETLIFYGTGFGPVTSGTSAGQIAQGQSALSASVQFNFGTTAAQVNYAGLAPGLVGVDQFNVVVPSGLKGDQPLQIQVNDASIPQNLVISLQN